MSRTLQFTFLRGSSTFHPKYPKLLWSSPFKPITMSKYFYRVLFQQFYKHLKIVIKNIQIKLSNFEALKRSQPLIFPLKCSLLLLTLIFTKYGNLQLDFGIISMRYVVTITCTFPFYTTFGYHISMFFIPVIIWKIFSLTTVTNNISCI